VIFFFRRVQTGCGTTHSPVPWVSAADLHLGPNHLNSKNPFKLSVDQKQCNESGSLSAQEISPSRTSVATRIHSMLSFVD
jgi:hypothetical protein